MSDLPPPRVPKEAYDEGYYREWCAGYEEWVATDGAGASGIYGGFLARAGLAPGEVVVDIGAGRGELVALAAELGAAHAYGIEYSPDALALATKTVATRNVGDRVDLCLADARSVPLPDGIADLVCYVDVVEHLTPDELHASLLQARRLLKPGGRVVAHTMPNRLVYDVTYRALRAVVGRSWPRDPRNDFERLMHVNEQTPRALRSAFERAGLRTEVELGAWVYDDFVPSRVGRRVLGALARRRLTAQFGVGDLWAVGSVS